MEFMYLLCVILSSGLFAYLGFALLLPEKF
jgi:K+-transporting ATPase KdpF subunit